MSKDKVVRLPGKTEAKAIASDMMIAKQGVFAWVSAGLRLADVKARLPHGEFMKWVESNLTQCQIWSYRHMHRARLVAENLLEANELGVTDALKVCADSKHPLWVDVQDKSTRQLSLEVGEKDQSVEEDKAKLHCEEIWAADPDLRDQFEPDVLAGECGYIDAYNRMMRKEQSEGKSRPKANYTALIATNFKGLVRNAAKFNSLTERQKKPVIDAAIEFAKNCPPEIASVLSPILKKK